MILTNEKIIQQNETTINVLSKKSDNLMKQ